MSKKSPSTLRHQLGLAERSLAKATELRDEAQARLAAETDYTELGRHGEQLATCQAKVDAAEEYWLSLADEAESIGMEL